MSDQERKLTREMDDSEKESISVITCDMEGRIETFNEGAEKIFGYRADEVIGKMRVSGFSPGNVVLGHVKTWLDKASNQGEFQSNTTFVHKDGSPIPAEVRITPTYKTVDGEKIQIGYCGQTRVLEGADPAETPYHISAPSSVSTQDGRTKQAEGNKKPLCIQVSQHQFLLDQVSDCKLSAHRQSKH